MDIETIRRLTLARHLFQLGSESLRSANDMHLFSAVNLFQDAVEAFLIAIAEHIGADIDQNTKFDKYFTQIHAKISPKELPFRGKLIRLNRIRIDSKHYAIQPARDECDRIALSVKEFFEEVSSSLLNANFSTVSTIDLLHEGETKSVLLDAKAALDVGDFEYCAISCRKALYLEIEKSYDISAYNNDSHPGLLKGFTNAPAYARNKEYIDSNVNDPTDFIVYDHSNVNEKLLTKGADNTAYWNVWRLTPEVYKTKDGNWVVKHDFAKLDSKVLNDKIDYIFSATLDVILSIERSSQATQWGTYGNYYINLNQENVPIYRKADKTSIVTAHTPPGMIKIETNYRIDGLSGDGTYWHVMHFEKNFTLYGFIHNDFVA